MRSKHEAQGRHFPVALTLAQRVAVAEVLPGLSGRLRLDESNQRAVLLTLDELKAVCERATPAIRRADTGMKRNSLRHVLDTCRNSVEHFQGVGVISARQRVYQFKITLKGITPPVWRRIQVRDGSLDKFHERIQTAMGWTNSHLHHFRVGDTLYGDPWLMEEDFAEVGYVDSRETRLSRVLPESGGGFRFKYDYDFGDSWWHQVLFEGCLRAEPGQRYPVCVEGERACPLEDVGGVSGYGEFLAVLAHPGDERHEGFVAWSGGRFDPESFDPERATRRMRRGLPDWRKMR